MNNIQNVQTVRTVKSGQKPMSQLPEGWSWSHGTARSPEGEHYCLTCCGHVGRNLSAAEAAWVKCHHCE